MTDRSLYHIEKDPWLVHVIKEFLPQQFKPPNPWIETPQSGRTPKEGFSFLPYLVFNIYAVDLTAITTTKQNKSFKP